MPYDLRLDGSLLRIRFLGVFTRQDFTKAMEETEALERRVAVVPDRLTDLSDMIAFEPDYAFVASIAANRRTRVFPNDFRTAIVAPNEVAFGYARMFQTLNDNRQIAIHVVSSVAEAEAWLGLRRRPDAD